MDERRSSLKEVYEYLRQFKLSESLYLIGAINSALKFGFKTLNKEHIPADILLWLSRMGGKESYHMQIYLNSSRIARFLMLSGANDYRNKTLSLGDGSFEKASKLVGELYEEDVEKKGNEALNFDRIFARLSQWQFPLQTDVSTIIGRAYLLYIIIPAEIACDYSLEDKMKEYFGLGAFEFMATGLGLWFKTNGTLDYELKVEIDYLKNIVTPANQLRFLQLSSGMAVDYRKLVRGGDGKIVNNLFDIYFLDPFLKIPAIGVEHSLKFRSDSYIVPQPKYLLDRAGSGLFYLLADKKQEIGLAAGNAKQNPFRLAFGSIYRAYVGKQLRQCANQFVFIDLDTDITPIKDKKIPDFAIVKSDICLLFEVKTSLLKLEAKVFFEDDQLRKEVKGGSIQKAMQQLSEFRKMILADDIKHNALTEITRVINIVVGYEDIFIANSNLLPLLKENYGNLVTDLQLACISDIDALGTAFQNNFDVIELLIEKIDNPEFVTWPIVSFFEKKVKRGNKILFDSFHALMDRLTHGVGNQKAIFPVFAVPVNHGYSV